MANQVEITQPNAEPLDLLDPSSFRGFRKRVRFTQDEEDDDGEDFETDAKGRYIIPDDDDYTSKRSRRSVRDEMSVEQDMAGEEEEDDNDVQSRPSMQTKRKLPKRKEQSFGKEFKARKAGGDAKYKGAKTDPYAYIPLDHRMLNKRKKFQAVKQFNGVGKGSKKGYKSRASHTS